MDPTTHPSPIDTHVHFRGGEGNGDYLVYMDLAFKDAFDVGLRAAIAQGNTDPPLIYRETIEPYLDRMDAYRKGIEVAVHGVFTPDPEQQEHMMDLVEDPNIRVVSGKIFHVRSTGSGKIEITDRKQARESWMRGGRRNFNGNRTGHLEDGDLFQPVYDPTRPETHSLAQPPEAEPAKVEEQYKNAYDASFEGNFIIFHTSNPDTIPLIHSLNRRFRPKFRTIFEVTPHHMLLNSDEDYTIHGNNVKMNPPLRPKEMQERLFEAVLKGDVQTLGTDHAPHPRKRKIGQHPASGIPGILIYPKLIEILRNAGIKEDLLEDILFNNANELYFDGQLEPRTVETTYKPHLWIQRYGVNPYTRVDGTL